MAKKILLIEDEKFVRDMYERALTQRGYEVDSVLDGQAALDQLKKQSDYNLILLDIMLPKVNGIGVLKQIKDEGSPSKDTPVYLLTNLGQDNIIKEAFSLGAEGYLIKAALLPGQVGDEVDSFFEDDSG